ncbi:MAG: paraquat-inducible protein A, partial [Alphaproteobacteria bacterium]|nr:paraquat-inducible protein A [Alphaproteobacteria bacterium]
CATLRGMEAGENKLETLASSSTGADRWMGVWLGLSALLVCAGLFLPAVTVRRLFLSEEYSLAEGVYSFLVAGDWFLFLVTFAFTIVFPISKVGVCLALWFLSPRGSQRSVKFAGTLASLSKWSMLDVFVIALMVLVVDGRLLDSADIHVGVVAFTGGVLLSAWGARRIGILHGAGALFDQTRSFDGPDRHAG